MPTNREQIGIQLIVYRRLTGGWEENRCQSFRRHTLPSYTHWMLVDQPVGAMDLFTSSGQQATGLVQLNPGKSKNCNDQLRIEMVKIS